MALSPDEREGVLAGLPENIRQAVAARLTEVDSMEALNELVRALELEEQLRPLVDRVRGGDGDAFEPLWKVVKPKVHGIIRASLKYYGDEHFDEVESRVMAALWTQREEYTPGKGSYMTWARGIARNAARWYRPHGAREDELHDHHFVPADIELPPSACFSEVLRLLQDERPHYALAFLFNKYLGWTPQNIVAELSGVPLRDALTTVEKEVIGTYPTLRGFGVFLAPLRKRLEGSDQTLSELVPGHMRPEEAISHWAGDTARSIFSLVVKQAKAFLSLACRLRAAAHERLSFLWCCLLSKTPAQMASLRDRVLLDILAVFCIEYCLRTKLSDEQIAKSVDPLRTEIAPRRFLRECEHDDLCSDIARWRDRVRAMLLGPARTEHVLAYAYLCGCLPGLSGRSRSN